MSRQFIGASLAAAVAISALAMGGCSSRRLSARGANRGPRMTPSAARMAERRAPLISTRVIDSASPSAVQVPTLAQGSTFSESTFIESAFSEQSFVEVGANDAVANAQPSYEATWIDVTPHTADVLMSSDFPAARSSEPVLPGEVVDASAPELWVDVTPRSVDVRVNVVNGVATSADKTLYVVDPLFTASHGEASAAGLPMPGGNPHGDEASIPPAMAPASAAAAAVVTSTPKAVTSTPKMDAAAPAFEMPDLGGDCECVGGNCGIPPAAGACPGGQCGIPPAAPAAK